MWEVITKAGEVTQAYSSERPLGDVISTLHKG